MLNKDRLDQRCATHRHIGRHVRILRESTSTNDECHAAASDDALHGLVVFAEFQSAGRGMHGRAWVAPPESALLFSLLLFPPESLNRSEFLTAWSAVAVAEEIRFQFGLDGRIKWPNDVRIDDRKLCGILVERRVGTVVGIGLNVATRPEEFPVELRGCATSMRIECGREIDRTELAADLLFRLDRLYQEALDVGPISVWERWSDLAEDLAERPIVATTRRRQIAGRLLDVRPDRGARVVLPDGSVARIPSEELVRIEINRDDEW